jgi:hypothetical protein
MLTETMQTPIFREVQHPRQWWIWLIVVVLSAMMWYLFITQIILGQPYGNPPPDWVAWLLWLAIGVAFPLFFWTCHLTTEVRDDALAIIWFPLYQRRIAYQDIVQSEAVTYRPLLHYGGWGLRWSPSRGCAYSMSGNQGVQLVLRDGRRVLIGSHQPEELARAIDSRRREFPEPTAS